MSDDSFQVLALCLAVAAAGAALENTPIGRRISGAMIAIILAAVLSNAGVLPTAAPAYDVIWSYLVPLAIALFLLDANLITIFRSGGRALTLFLFGAFGVVAGTLLGASALPLGDFTPEYGALFSASFVGGSANFAAVADAVNTQGRPEVAAAMAVDNVLGLFYLVLIGAAARSSAVQKWLPARRPPDPEHRKQSGTPGAEERPVNTGADTEDSLFQILLPLAAAAMVCFAGKALADAFGHAAYSVLYITVIMLALATVTRWTRAQLASARSVAMLFMYLFFVVLGSGVDVRSIFESAPALFIFVAIIIIVHLAVMLAGAKALRLGYPEVVVISSACIGGPPIAVALATLMGWRHLVTAGLVTGIFGYAIGNFIGIGIHAVLG